MKICPRCGRSEEEVPFIGFLCVDCYLEEYKVIQIPKLKLIQCPTCGRIKLKRWIPFSVESVAQWVKRQIKVSADNYVVSVSVHPKDGKLVATFIVTGEISGVPFRKTGEIPIEIVKQQCPTCALRSAGYYEAVLQLRGKRVQEMLKFVEHFVGKSNDPKAFIVKVEDVRGGKDVYLGSRKLAERVSRLLRRQFHGSVKRSFTLVGEKNGRRIHRETIVVRVE